MDSKLMNYQSLIKKILNEYLDLFKNGDKPGVESVAIIDDQNYHYMLETVGWKEKKRVWYTTIYARIRDGKFWIEIDWTQDGIANALVASGVPKEDIVLAFHHPNHRRYTEFAVS